MTDHGIPVNKREHRHVRELLSAYADDELSHRDRSRVEQHLSQCADCRADLHSLRWTKRLLGQAPALKVPRSFVVREADLARSRPTRKRRSLWATQWATAVVALLFVAVMGSDLLLGSGAKRLGQSAPEAAWATEETGPTLAMVEVHKEAEKAVAVESEAPVRPGDDGAGAGTVIATDAANKEVVPEVRGVQTDTATAETPPPQAEKMMIQAEPETPDAEVILAAPEKEESTPVPPPLAAPEKEETTSVPTERDLIEGTDVDETPGDAPVETTYSGQPTGPNLRLVWRVVEIVLGTALIGLLVAVFWLRKRG